MNADPQTIKAANPLPTPQPKPAERGSLPLEVKTEIENLRRLAQTIQDRLHALTRA